MLEFFTLFFSLIVFTVVVSLLDKRFHLGLFEHMGMSLGLDLMKDENTTKSQSVKTLEAENQALKKRIEVLERIVTEPSYELNKEISKLK